MKTSTKVRLSFRLPVTLKRWILAAAKGEGRSVSGYITALAVKNGFQPGT